MGFFVEPSTTDAVSPVLRKDLLSPGTDHSLLEIQSKILFAFFVTRDALLIHDQFLIHGISSAPPTPAS